MIRLNKVALILLGIVLLEVILVTNHVESVKALKKKLILKKLKSFIPLLALVKPKKKILLIPIPFPMFNKNNHGMNNQHQLIPPNGGGAGGLMRPVNPNTIMLVDTLPAVNPIAPAPMIMFEPSSNMSTYESPTSTNQILPTIAMTISSDTGSVSAIELNTNMMAPVTSNQSSASASIPIMRAPLIQAPIANYDDYGSRKSNRIQSQPYIASNLNQIETINCQAQHYQPHRFVPNRPFLSPAKLLHSARIAQQRVHPKQVTRQDIEPQRPYTYSKDNSYYEYKQARVSGLSQQTHPVQEIENFEHDDYTIAGPPQFVPVYQGPNGRLHATPPPRSLATNEIENSGDDFNNEVHLIDRPSATVQDHSDTRSLVPMTKGPTRPNVHHGTTTTLSPERLRASANIKISALHK